jgi:hypothetical protein
MRITNFSLMDSTRRVVGEHPGCRVTGGFEVGGFAER